ncbi:MAG TPA: hypothetical protein VK818_20225 [Methylomirabilota bacterium]|jgi:hypothetical protein|nr:hypothetical protein [Methylomirabilota bacterium]
MQRMGRLKNAADGKTIPPILRILPQRRSATALRRVTEGHSERTIFIALFANIVIAIAKLIGGLVSGRRFAGYSASPEDHPR